MRDVVKVVVISLNFRHNTGRGPLNDKVIEFFDLTLDIVDVVLGVL